jgi:preprotein translocase subunit SecG
MGTFIIILILIVCFLLAAVILVQNPKGGGLATGFQGASQIGGVQKTADFLEKSTWYLTIALFVLCLAAAAVSDGGPGESDGQFMEEPVQTETPAIDGEGGDFGVDEGGAAE